MRKFLSFILIFTLCLCGTAFCYTPEYDISYGTAESLGYSLTATYIERSLTTYEDDKPIACVSISGSNGALINIVDVNAAEVIHTFKMDFSGYFYFGAVNYENFNVYMGIGKHVVEYNPTTKTATDLGTVLTTNSGNVNWVTVDSETGDVFGVASPFSYIWKYDVSEKKLSTFTSTLSGSAGLNGIAVSGNYIYVYAQDSDKNPVMAKINKENAADITYISLPTDFGTPTSVGQIYSGGNRIIAQITSSSGTYMRIYSIDTGVWEKTKFQMGTTSMTDMFENKFYYAYNGYLCSIDVTTLKLTEYRNMSAGSHLRGNGMFIEYEGMSGYSFVNSQYGGNLYVMNPTLGKTVQIPVTLKGAPIVHRISRLGTDGRIYVGGFKASSGAAVNPDTGEKETYASDQTEGITGYGTKMYLGGYAGGDIYELDTTKPYKNDYKSNPKKICTIGENQIRPFDLEVLNGGNTLAVASQCVAGEYGGALTIINLDTYAKKVYRNIVADQNLVTVTSKRTKVYAGSTITSGGNLAPKADNAHVIAFDTETETVTADVELKIPGCDKSIPIVKGLVAGADGDIYGYTPGAYFVLDSETLEMKRYNLFDESQIETDRSASLQLWHETFMHFDPTSGYLIVNGTFVNPITLKDIATPPQELASAMFAGISEDGTAYFVDSNTTLYKIKVFCNEVPKEIYTESFDGGESAVFSNVGLRRPQALPTEYINGAARICAGIGSGYGDGGYKDKNLRSCEILNSRMSSGYTGKLIAAADIMLEKDNITAVLAPRGTHYGDFGGLYFGFCGTNVVAQDETVGKISVGKWYRLTAKYNITGSTWCGEYYLDGVKVGEAQTSYSVPCVSLSLNINVNADESTTTETRFDSRGEYFRIDNLAVSADEDLYESYSGGVFGKFDMNTEFSEKYATTHISAGFFENAEGNIYTAYYSGGKLVKAEKTPFNVKKYRDAYFVTDTENCDETKVFAWGADGEPKCIPNIG